MTPRIISITVLVGGIFAIVLYLGMREDKAEQRGVDKQVAADIAKANQELAVKRERDAKFDKMDARAFCLDAGFEWLFIDGKSLCR